ncbi:MAG: TetR/AcrR family transcriptional regulator [Nitratireductor sp.]
MAFSDKQATPQKQAVKSERMRSAILDKAVGRLAELGYHATSIKKIAAEGGFSIGALQHHFPSKEELMVAVVEKALERAERYVLRFVERGHTNLGSVIEASWDEQINSPWYKAMLEIFVAARTDEALRARVAPAIERYSRETEARLSHLLAPETGGDKATFLLKVSRCMLGGFMVQDALAMPRAEISAFIRRWAEFLDANLKGNANG